MRPTKAHPRLTNGSKAHAHAQPHHTLPYSLGHFERDTEQGDDGELETVAAPEAVCISTALPPTPDKEGLSSVRSPITTTTSEYIRAEDSSPVRLGPS